MNNILLSLGNSLRRIVTSHEDFIQANIFEIRLRINSPIYIRSIHGNYFLDYNKKSSCISHDYYLIKKKDIDETMSNFTLNSIHAFEKEIQNGYITIEGGHRVGISGDCIYEKDTFKGFKNITSLNIRIAREFKDCSLAFLKYLIKNNKDVYNTLIIGPPMSGKTTFIRDVAINLSNGLTEPFFQGIDLTIIDERGEISSMYNGTSQMDVGFRTDILAYCMKKEGFIMSIRALSPKVIISDELGSKDDFEIIQYALKSGVNIITTAHGSDIEDVKKNIYLKNIIENQFFDRIVVLDSIKKGLTVKQIIDIPRSKVIYDVKN